MIKTNWLGSQRIDLESCGSTNDEAARLARAGASHGTVVISESQTAGRGRDGRVWRSPPGGLYLSAIVRPPLAIAAVPPMTLAIGIGACDAVRACGVGGVLKWPNDVLVEYEGGAKKLAGVLVESQSQAGRVDAVIVGIGINVSEVGMAEVSTIATNLEREVGEPVERELVIQRLLGHVERWIDRYVAIGLSAIIPAWHERMAHGLVARTTIDGELVIGEVAGLDPDGSLMLRDDQGKVRRIHSGDVEVLRPTAIGSGPVAPANAC